MAAVANAKAAGVDHMVHFQLFNARGLERVFGGLRKPGPRSRDAGPRMPDGCVRVRQRGRRGGG